MKIAHLSDLHVSFPEVIKASMFFTGWHPNRRILGGANFLLRRSSIHSVEVLEKAIDAVSESGADFCIVTGDVTNLAIDAEFQNVRAMLNRIGGPDRLAVIPGNHDYYTPEAIRAGRFESHLGDLLWGGAGWSGERDENGLPAGYPVVRDFEGVRLILTRTAMQPPPGMAWGRFGRAQLESVERLAAQGAESGRFVIVAQHHHLHVRPEMVDRITGEFKDRDAELEMISRSRIGLVIHGHDHRHRDWVTPSQHESGGTRVICCGSSTYLDHGRSRFGRMTVFDVTHGRLVVEKWMYSPESRRFVRCAEV